MEQLKEDIKIFNKAFPNSMTENEAQTFEEVKKLYERKIKVKCTGCSYCMLCPSGVNIPGAFWHYNRAFMDDPEVWKESYKSFFCNNKMDASQCNECGQCEKACPQHITVIDKLEEAHKYLMSE